MLRRKLRRLIVGFGPLCPSLAARFSCNLQGKDEGKSEEGRTQGEGQNCQGRKLRLEARPCACWQQCKGGEIVNASTTTHEGLLAGFHGAWAFVHHGSAPQIRLQLSNLKTARTVCLHLAEDSTI